MSRKLLNNLKSTKQKKKWYRVKKTNCLFDVNLQFIQLNSMHFTER